MVWAIALLVAAVGVLHGAGHLLAARAVGRRPARPWRHLIPGWSCIACSRDPVRWPARVIVQLGGLAASYLGLVALAFVSFAVIGVPSSADARWRVAGVGSGTPADGVLRVEDVIEAVDGQVVRAPAQPLSPIIDRAGGAPLSFRVIRDGAPVELAVRPALDPGSGRYRLGIELQLERVRVRVAPGAALIGALGVPVAVVRALIASERSGPGGDPGSAIRIVQTFRDALEPAAAIVIRAALTYATQLALLLLLVDLIAWIVAAARRRTPAAPV